MLAGWGQWGSNVAYLKLTSNPKPKVCVDSLFVATQNLWKQIIVARDILMLVYARARHHHT